MTRESGYAGRGRVAQAFCVLVGLGMTYIALEFARLLILALTTSRDPVKELAVIWFPLAFLLVLGSSAMALFNAYPTVWISDDELVLSVFVLGKKRIPWHDVLAVRELRPWPARYTVVSARRITSAHRLVGWSYGRTMRPSFVIWTSIANYEELCREIRARADAARGRS